MKNYCITSTPNYQQNIAELVSMLELTRSLTLQDIQHLTMEELDFVLDENSNSIAALLMHIAFIEYVHQVITFEDRDLTEAEQDEWLTAFELGPKANELYRGKPIEHYLEILSEIRSTSFEKLKNYSSDWLLKEKHLPNGLKFNNYYYWFHVLEEEISHRGQIRLIKRLIKAKPLKAGI